MFALNHSLHFIKPLINTLARSNDVANHCCCSCSKYVSNASSTFFFLCFQVLVGFSVSIDVPGFGPFSAPPPPLLTSSSSSPSPSSYRRRRHHHCPYHTSWKHRPEIWTKNIWFSNANTTYTDDMHDYFLHKHSLVDACLTPCGCLIPLNDMRLQEAESPEIPCLSICEFLLCLTTLCLYQFAIAWPQAILPFQYNLICKKQQKMISDCVYCI